MIYQVSQLHVQCFSWLILYLILVLISVFGHAGVEGDEPIKQFWVSLILGEIMSLYWFSLCGCHAVQTAHVLLHEFEAKLFQVHGVIVQWTPGIRNTMGHWKSVLHVYPEFVVMVHMIGNNNICLYNPVTTLKSIKIISFVQWWPNLSLWRSCVQAPQLTLSIWVCMFFVFGLFWYCFNHMKHRCPCSTEGNIK